MSPITLTLTARVHCSYFLSPSRFQALLKTYDQLAELILHSIRIDIRCRTIHYLDAAMRHGNYNIDHEAGEPDPHIIDLNAEIGQCDDFISTTLPKREQQ